MITEKLMRLTVAGGSEWVMVLLLCLSVISIAIIVERALYFRRRRRSLDRLDELLTPLINSDDSARMKALLERESGEPTLRAAVAGHDSRSRDRAATEKIVASSLGRERLRLERRLTFLGTLGNNAPFIGLFGTVLGIIRAFHDLSLESRTNTSAVMAGISEALVATAVGLFVALPAVLFYNLYQRQVDRTLAITEALSQGILAGVPAGATEAARSGDGGGRVAAATPAERSASAPTEA
jgi:biopolymer transport protein ExbB/TolQ